MRNLFALAFGCAVMAITPAFAQVPGCQEVAGQGSVCTGKYTFANGFVLQTSTVSALPACNAASKGTMRAVSDATAPAYNGTLTGGGAVAVPVYCSGTAWLAH